MGTWSNPAFGRGGVTAGTTKASSSPAVSTASKWLPGLTPATAGSSRTTEREGARIARGGAVGKPLAALGGVETDSSRDAGASETVSGAASWGTSPTEEEGALAWARSVTTRTPARPVVARGADRRWFPRSGFTGPSLKERSPPRFRTIPHLLSLIVPQPRQTLPITTIVTDAVIFSSLPGIRDLPTGPLSTQTGRGRRGGSRTGR